MFLARERAALKGIPSTPRPTTLVSIPAPLMFLPISSRMRMSTSGNGRDGIQDRAWASRAGSRASISAAGTTSTCASW